MIVNVQIPLHRLVLSLSEGLDRVHPAIVDHQLRVAYMSTNIARRMGIGGEELLAIFEAAALHDIGLVRLADNVRLMYSGQIESVAWHAEAGYELLRDQELLSAAAGLIRHHHVAWGDGRGAERMGEAVPMGSHIIALADTVEQAFDADLPVLEQSGFIRERITAGAGESFHPDCVAAFEDVSQAEAFWLDSVSKRIYGILLEQMDWPTVTVDEHVVGNIAEAFARVVDALSPWTATHSAGVAAGAIALSELLGFSPRELKRMRAAGYLHDIGKLSVPNHILDSSAKPTPQEWAIIRGHTYHTFRILHTIGGMPQIAEWAAFHHERIDGTGYPFRHGGSDLMLGSRIMAVADVFTALTEDRPYRKGMELPRAAGVLEKQVESGALDGDVVAALGREKEAVHSRMKREKALYAEKQRQLTRFNQHPVLTAQYASA